MSSLDVGLDHGMLFDGEADALDLVLALSGFGTDLVGRRRSESVNIDVSFHVLTNLSNYWQNKLKN